MQLRFTMRTQTSSENKHTAVVRIEAVDATRPTINHTVVVGHGGSVVWRSTGWASISMPLGFCPDLELDSDSYPRAIMSGSSSSLLGPSMCECLRCCRKQRDVSCRVQAKGVAREEKFRIPRQRGRCDSCRLVFQRVLQRRCG